MPYCGVHYPWFSSVCLLIRSHPPPPPVKFPSNSVINIHISNRPVPGGNHFEMRSGVSPPGRANAHTSSAFMAPPHPLPHHHLHRHHFAGGASQMDALVLCVVPRCLLPLGVGICRDKCTSLRFASLLHHSPAPSCCVQTPEIRGKRRPGQM